MYLKFSRKNISLTGQTVLERRICCWKLLIEFVFEKKKSKTKTKLFYFLFSPNCPLFAIEILLCIGLKEKR